MLDSYRSAKAANLQGSCADVSPHSMPLRSPSRALFVLLFVSNCEQTITSKTKTTCSAMRCTSSIRFCRRFEHQIRNFINRHPIALSVTCNSARSMAICCSALACAACNHTHTHTHTHRVRRCFSWIIVSNQFVFDKRLRCFQTKRNETKS
jgi:hypothetical protein